MSDRPTAVTPAPAPRHFGPGAAGAAGVAGAAGAAGAEGAEGRAGRRALRADARRNRQRLLDVALDAFVEHGIGASLDEIARRAGVGIGTLYRHFPTREALVDALVREGVDELCRKGDELLAADDPTAALATWLRALVDHTSRFSGLATAIAKASAGTSRPGRHHDRPTDADAPQAAGGHGADGDGGPGGLDRAEPGHGGHDGHRGPEGAGYGDGDDARTSNHGGALAESCARVSATGGALMARARAAGQLRRDVPDADVIDLAASIAWIRDHAPRDDAQVDRLLALVLDAVTADPHRSPHPPA